MHSRNKYVDIDYYFLKGRIQAKTLQVSFLSSKDLIVDNFTKPSTLRFCTLRSSLTILFEQFGLQGDSSIHSVDALSYNRSQLNKNILKQNTLESR